MLQQSHNQKKADQIGQTNLAARQQMLSQPDNIIKNLVEFEPPNFLGTIDRLETTILNSLRVPLTGKTCVDEEDLLDQIDLLRASLPAAIASAQEILQHKHQIITAAQQQAQQTISAAHQHAYELANELGIVERSEQEANHIRQMVIAECEQLRQQTMIEVQQIRDRNLQELEQLRQEVLGECDRMHAGADEYADRVLHNMEYQLKDVLQSIHSGRERLSRDANAIQNQTFTLQPEVTGLKQKLKQIRSRRNTSETVSMRDSARNKSNDN